jgi:iron complex transport system ATP-binding protein
LARLLVGNARLLLLDEPVQSLDPAGALAVMGVLSAAAADGLAVAMVVHDMTLAAQFCDDVMVLDKGRLVAQGPPQEVLSPSQLTPIFGVEFDAIEARGHRILVPRA